MANYEIDDVEMASILAGLRALVELKSGTIDITGGRRRAIQAIASNCNEYDALSISQIDDLCERLNCEESPT